jgi:nitrosocyanin
VGGKPAPGEIDDYSIDGRRERSGEFMWKGLQNCLRVVLSIALAAALSGSFSAATQAQSVTQATLVNIAFNGTKIWVPGPVVVKKGDTVRIKLINNVESDPPVHGLAIEAYGVQALVHVGKPEMVEFKADKVGIFPVACHLHPAHVGTQLVVLE